MRSIATVVFFRMIGWLFALAGVAVSATSAHADKPVFHVGGKDYDLRQVCGSTEKEMRSEFDSEVKALSLDQIKYLLAYYGYSRNDPKWRDRISRAEAVEALWKNRFHHFLYDAVDSFVGAHYCDNIVREQGVQLESYFDPRPLRDALRRQERFQLFMHKHKATPPEEDDRLLAEAVKAFRRTGDKKKWSEFRKSHRDIAFLGGWWSRMRQGMLRDDVAVKALLPQYILQEVCERGAFFAKAKRLYEFEHSTVQELKLTGFRGDRKQLEDYLRQAVDKDGYFTSRGAIELKLLLHELSPGVGISHVEDLGRRFAYAYDTLAVPTIGSLYWVAPDSLRFFTWGKQIRVREPVEPKAKARYDGMARMYACRLAGERYLPPMRSYVPGWDLKREKFLSYVSSPSKNPIGSVEVDNFIKKPYPAKLFQEFEDHRAALDDYIVAAAGFCLRKDRDGGRKLYQELRERGRTVEGEQVRRAYLAIAARLAKNLSLLEQ